MKSIFVLAREPGGWPGFLIRGGSLLFIHLHVHSPFSFLDGASPLERLIDRAAQLDMGALALTDHDNVCGAVRFHRLTQAKGIKPIQGVEITLAGGQHLTLLAKGPGGYANICRLITKAHLDNPRGAPQITREDLALQKEGLIVLSGCRRGPIAALLLQGDYDGAKELTQWYKKTLGQDFYLELPPPHLPGGRRLNRLLVELGELLGIPLVATGNVHYAVKADYPICDLLTCLRTGTTLEDVHPLRRLNGEEYLKSPQEMKALFADHPQALNNSYRIAAACEPSLELNRNLFPRFPAKEKASHLLRRLVWEGAHRRYGRLSPAVRHRLEHELSIIEQLDVADYFLVVWDVARFARSQGIRYAGRGSAADSAVAYCLKITEVDAIARGLLFERFLSLERAQRPDIDLDFDARYRDLVANYVYDKYGSDRVASVCTFNTFRARSAIRKVGKALGFAPEELDLLAKRFPHIPADAIEPALGHFPELGFLKREKRYELLWRLCAAVAGLPRFIGTHLGGLVISGIPLVQITPLQQAAKGVLITQFDKDDIEELGFIKLDLLSLRTLSVVEDAVCAINHLDDDFSYPDIPLDDEKTYQMLGRGETVGVFQLESPAQRALQARLGADNIEDIVSSVALIRPGPIKGDMVEPFIARRQGKEETEYLDPRLEPILAKTHGVILFQEQVLEIAISVAGFSPGEADNLRKVLSSLRSQRELDELGRQFVARAQANGMDAPTAEAIFSLIAGYAGYGFCEAHAAAFGTTAYKTAYLAAHYPAQFFAALLSHQPMGFYPPHTIRLEASRRGISFLPVDINQSGPDYLPGQGTIRISLGQVKGIGALHLEAILQARQAGPFTSLKDFCRRVELPQHIVMNLILAGAFDNLHPNRRALLWQLRKGPDRGELPGLAMPPPQIDDFSPYQKFLYEYSILGLTAGGHLIGYLRPQLKKRGILTRAQLESYPSGKKVQVAGLAIRPHRPPTKSGRTVVFLTLEDETGLLDITVFEDVYQRFGHLLFSCPALIVEGTIQRRGAGLGIIARRVEALPLKGV